MSQNQSSRTLLHRLFPFESWLKWYQISFLHCHAIAGLTVAVVLIPQAVAAASIQYLVDLGNGDKFQFDEGRN